MQQCKKVFIINNFSKAALGHRPQEIWPNGSLGRGPALSNAEGLQCIAIAGQDLAMEVAVSRGWRNQSTADAGRLGAWRRRTHRSLCASWRGQALTRNIHGWLRKPQVGSTVLSRNPLDRACAPELFEHAISARSIAGYVLHCNIQAEGARLPSRVRRAARLSTRKHLPHARPR